MRAVAQFAVDWPRRCTLSRSKIRFRALNWALLQDQGSGCDYRKVLLSLVYRLMRSLFDLLTVPARADLSKDVELLVLRHENQVLRRLLGSRHPFWAGVAVGQAQRDDPAI